MQVVVNYALGGFHELVLPALDKAATELSDKFSLEYKEHPEMSGFMQVTVTSGTEVNDFGPFWKAYGLHRNYAPVPPEYGVVVVAK